MVRSPNIFSLLLQIGARNNQIKNVELQMLFHVLIFCFMSVSHVTLWNLCNNKIDVQQRQNTKVHEISHTERILRILRIL